MSTAVNVYVKIKGLKVDFFKKLCLFEPKKMIRAYKSFGENVRGKNEPFPFYLYYNA